MHAYRAALEYVCDLVEGFLAAKKVPCHVTGGTISPERVQLFLDPGPHVWIKSIYEQIPALALYLGMEELRRGNDGLLMVIPTDRVVALHGDRHLLPRREVQPGHVLELTGGEYETPARNYGTA